MSSSELVQTKFLCSSCYEVEHGVASHLATSCVRQADAPSLLPSSPPRSSEEERGGHYGRSLSKPIHYLISGGGVREGRGEVGVGKNNGGAQFTTLSRSCVVVGEGRY